MSPLLIFHPVTNGLAERAVQIVKKGLKKEKGGTMASRIAKGLMAYRTTPQSTTGVSPSELLQGRRIRTHLDLLKPNVTERIEQRQLQQKLSHDSSSRWMYFSIGETVYAQNFGTGQKWMPAVVQEVTGPVSFLVKLQDSRLVRRHQDHLRRRIPDGEDEKPVSDDFPEILIDSFPVAPNCTDDGSTPENPGPAADPTETPTVNEPTPDTTVAAATDNAVTPSPSDTSRLSKTYPTRLRKQPNKQPDWFYYH